MIAVQAGIFAILPAWSQFHSSVGIKVYERTRTNSASFTEARRRGECARRGNLVHHSTAFNSLGMLQNVTLVPQYERDDLTEMAMDGNTEYLSRFRDDMESQRFKFIIVDPLKFQFLGSDRSFGEENNVWVRWAINPILCNYQLDVAYPEYDIAIYVP